MTRTTRQLWLSIVAALSAILLVVALRMPRTPARGSLATTPADWLLASKIVDSALDSDSPRRLALWRTSYAHAKLLAPHRPNGDAAFVRAGLFHWTELQEQDRARVLKAAQPLMREPAFFARMHLPLLQLTGDFRWVQQSAPATLETRVALRNLALSRGLFHEYRLLREEIRQKRLRTFAARRRIDDPSTLLNLLPERLDWEHEPLARGILEELDRQAFDPAQISPSVEQVVQYALDHNLGPLTGTVPLLEAPSRLRDVTRARIALKLDRATIASRIELTSNDGAEWRPYYLERARFAARRGEAAAADAYLVRASADGLTVPVLAAAVDVARLLGKTADGERYRAQLARTPPAWQGLCGADEICSHAIAQEWTDGRRRQKLTLTNVQSDETPPYVEIYVHGTRLAEGEVQSTRTFEIPVAEGLHEIEIRLVNPRTRNGAQRRLRLS